MVYSVTNWSVKDCSKNRILPFENMKENVPHHDKIDQFGEKISEHADYVAQTVIEKAYDIAPEFTVTWESNVLVSKFSIDPKGLCFLNMAFINWA